MFIWPYSAYSTTVESALVIAFAKMSTSYDIEFNVKRNLLFLHGTCLSLHCLRSYREICPTEKEEYTRQIEV